MTQLFVLGNKQTYILFSGSLPGTTYDWTANTPANAIAIGLNPTNGNNTISSFVSANNTNTPITVNIQVTPTLNACPGNPSTFNITIDPAAIIDAGGGPTSTIGLCSGGITNLQGGPWRVNNFFCLVYCWRWNFCGY